MSTCSELFSKLTALWEKRGVGNPNTCQTAFRKLYLWGLGVIFLEKSYREAGYIQPNLRSLPPKASSVLGWNGCLIRWWAHQHEGYASRAWVWLLELLLSVGSWGLDEMLSRATFNCEVLFRAFWNVSLLPAEVSSLDYVIRILVETSSLNISGGHSSILVSDTTDDFPAASRVQWIIKIRGVFPLGLKFPALMAQIGGLAGDIPKANCDWWCYFGLRRTGTLGDHEASGKKPLLTPYKMFRLIKF